MRINPYFEIDKKRYELKRTRYLMVEYEKISENNSAHLSNEDKVNAVKLQNMATQVRELAEQLKELKEIYYADMTNKVAKAQYKACKEEYNEAFDELARFEVESGGSSKLEQATLNALERIVILGLAEQHFDGDLDKSENTWCSWVDIVGKETAGMWLMAMAESLFGVDEEEENSFLAQIRAKNEQRAENKRNALAKIK